MEADREPVIVGAHGAPVIVGAHGAPVIAGSLAVPVIMGSPDSPWGGRIINILCVALRMKSYVDKTKEPQHREKTVCVL